MKRVFISSCLKEMTLDEFERFPTRSLRAAICYYQSGETPEEHRQYAVLRKKKTSGKA